MNTIYIAELSDEVRATWCQPDIGAHEGIPTMSAEQYKERLSSPSHPITYFNTFESEK